MNEFELTVPDLWYTFQMLKWFFGHVVTFFTF